MSPPKQRAGSLGALGGMGTMGSGAMTSRIRYNTGAQPQLLNANLMGSGTNPLRFSYDSSASHQQQHQQPALNAMFTPRGRQMAQPVQQQSAPLQQTGSGAGLGGMPMIPMFAEM